MVLFFFIFLVLIPFIYLYEAIYQQIFFADSVTFQQ